MPHDAAVAAALTPPTDGAPAENDLLRFEASADHDDIRALLARVVARTAARIAPDDAGALELALAEILNNVAEHGYACRSPGQPPGRVRVDLCIADGVVLAVVEDSGQPLPRGLIDRDIFPEPGVAVTDLPEGGFGWPLIRALTDDIAYVRAGAVNRVSFRLLRSTADAALPQSCGLM